METTQKHYIEGTGSIILPRITAVLLLPFFKNSKTEVPFLGLGYSLSIGYQFKPLLGFGITTKNDLLIDYSTYRINNLLVDYRVVKGQNNFTFHTGFVTPLTKLGDEDCKIKLDNTKLGYALGVSYKWYSKKNNFMAGTSLIFSRVRTDEYCYSVPLRIYESKKQNRDYLILNYYIGLHFPKQYFKTTL